MMIQKTTFWKSKLLFVFTMVTSLFLFTKCMPVDDGIDNSQITIFYEEGISFEKEGGAITIEVKSSNEWSIAKGADANWIKVTPISGLKGVTKLNIDVENNDGEARECSLIITASSTEKTITIYQKGEDVQVMKYTTINEIRTMYAINDEEEWTIADRLQLKGVVISDRTGGNRPSQRDGFIQDEAGDGLAFRVTQSTHSYDMGDELSIDLKGATVLMYGGVLQINFSNNASKVVAHNLEIVPRELTIEKILNGAYDGTLVKIKDVQFKVYKDLSYWEKGNATNRILESCNDATIIVKTTKYASFKDKALPAGKGSIVGIVSLNNGTWQLAIRNLEDVKEMSNDETTRCASTFIVTDNSSIDFDNEGGQKTINISANVNWVASSTQPWLIIAPESGSNDGMITVIASKNEDAERKANITITDGAITETILVTQKAEEEEGGNIVAADLFFSEYVEGSSNNKYLEIYNGTGTTVDLSDYRIELYVNGQSAAKSTEILTGALEDGKVVVLRHSKAVVYDGEATTSSVINFNGNDAIALVNISTGDYIDIFGCIGDDPGSKGWVDLNNTDLTTVDKTLVRKSSISKGVSINPVNRFAMLSSDWISYPVNTVKYLGSHTMN